MTNFSVTRLIATLAMMGFSTIAYSEEADYLADYERGIAYVSGNAGSSTEDLELARCWLRKSAAQDYQPAVHALGWLYYKGLGVEQDLDKAFSHFEVAARAGYNESQYMLGVMYGQGWGVEKDSIQSLQWMRIAAEQGHTNASSLLKALHINR